jgi:cytochrome P450
MANRSSEIRKQVEMAIAFNRAPLEFLQNDAASASGSSRFKIGPANFVHVFDPTLIKHVLQSGYKNYARSKEFEVLKPIMGNGLPTNEGESWLKQRRLIQPFFHSRYISSFSKQMTESTAAMLVQWQDKKDGVVEDVFSEMIVLTLDIITKTLFGYDMKEKILELKQVTTVLIELLSKNMQSAIGSFSTDTSQQKEIEHNTKLLSDIISEVVNSRSNSNTESFDLLNMLMQAEDADSKEKIGHQQLKDELVSLLLTGHETSSVALTFALHLIYSYPEVRDKFINELKTLNGKPPSPEDMRSLPYTLQIIHETLRLYPPLWNITREAINDDKTDGLDIRKGDTVLVSPYVMHRDSRFWENPETFSPERFNDMSRINEFAYFPFGLGPRKCIGNQFALMSMTISLAMIGQQFILTPISSGKINLNPLITIRPKEKISMKLTKV